MMNPKPTLLLTVGLPRSGKSTWARSTELPMVNPDSIRLALHGKAFDSAYEDEVWRLARLMVKSLFIAGHSYVILDATNLTEQRRREWDSELWDTGYVEFHTPVEVCTQRAITSNTPYLIPVINRMAAQREPLTEDERLMEFDSEKFVNYYSRPMIGGRF